MGYKTLKLNLYLQMEIKLSDAVSYVEEGKVPYPILVALHAKNTETSQLFHGMRLIFVSILLRFPFK